MSTGIDIKFVQERYQGMTDDELIRIATQDAYGLTPEAMEVVKAEIHESLTSHLICFVTICHCPKTKKPANHRFAGFKHLLKLI